MKVTYKKLGTKIAKPSGHGMTAYAVYATHSKRFVGIVYRAMSLRRVDWRREYSADVRLTSAG